MLELYEVAAVMVFCSVMLAANEHVLLGYVKLPWCCLWFLDGVRSLCSSVMREYLVAPNGCRTQVAGQLAVRALPVSAHHGCRIRGPERALRAQSRNGAALACAGKAPQRCKLVSKGLPQGNSWHSRPCSFVRKAQRWACDSNPKA